MSANKFQKIKRVFPKLGVKPRIHQTEFVRCATLDDRLNIYKFIFISFLINQNNSHLKKVNQYNNYSDNL